MEKNDKYSGFVSDRLLHEPARLQIVTYLISKSEEVPFTTLKQELDFTAGNLSVQLKKLEEAGYINIQKTFRNNRPWTGVSLTPIGLDAVHLYLHELEAIVKQLKGNMPE